MYLDAGLQVAKKEAQQIQLGWLNRFGRTAIFIKNDIKLILRNKRSKMTLWVSLMFLFYGLLFFTDSSGGLYDNPVWKIFAGIFVSGGFLFTFGQYVPSWDSAYYPLMMSQNIAYREYLNAKWSMITIATAVSTLLGSFYMLFGWDVYAAILAGAVYNIGVNAPSSSDYSMNGNDLNGTVTGNDPSLTFNVGDTINFNVAASGHPFFLIKNSNGGFGADNLIEGVSNNGAENATISWTSLESGTYYYICEYHPSMIGIITVNE